MGASNDEEMHSHMTRRHCAAPHPIQKPFTACEAAPRTMPLSWQRGKQEILSTHILGSQLEPLLIQWTEMKTVFASDDLLDVLSEKCQRARGPTLSPLNFYVHHKSMFKGSTSRSH